ncbi:ribosomal-protein-alanine acetyltransferase [Deltaproteobacteria bacterium]|nr:ribosomal-protein-alanine acetyltransferase [Deltaproteobacteria bacterium]
MTTVREIHAGDLDRLLALQQACFGDEAWTRGMIHEELDRPGGIFLGIGSPLIGFVCAWAVLDELHLLQIGVDPEARRAGLASVLHGALLVAARGRASAAWLEVRADNVAAIAFYLRLGWVEVGRRPRYYADGEDALLFRLEGLGAP